MGAHGLSMAPRRRRGRPCRAAARPRPDGTHHEASSTLPDKHHADLPAFPAPPELNPVEKRLAISPSELALKHTVFENLRRNRRRRMPPLGESSLPSPKTITSIGMRDWAHVGQPAMDLWY